VGTAAGDLIPVAQAQGGGFVKDESGAFVRSRLDEPALKAIAALRAGLYVPLGTQGEGLEAIFSAVLGTMAKHESGVAAAEKSTSSDINGRWRISRHAARQSCHRTRRRHGVQAAAASGAVAAAGLMLMMTARVAARASCRRCTGARFEAAGAGLQCRYRGVPDWSVRASRAILSAIISHAPSSDLKRLGVQEDAYYNLGNALYRAGQKTEQSSRQKPCKSGTML